ncbi:hypothetical protein CYMTET_13085 [Cymbomonas tetramitiformis]|uniref:Uncharacterized protein n=1 Tax=Cymbomonas tetramitiformis TaxID=36881 RepID=A0AAE0GJ90_9CHLO|nr:hypothetical protein CYMTET_13085 [Cymbomonas tetramitiformis]
MQTAGQAGGGKGAEAQALSDGEEDEAEYDSNFNEREEHASEEHVGSAGEEEVTGDHSEVSSMPELQARAAVALGNTQKMQGFPVKTPQEFDKDAQVPRAVPADFLSRKMHLMASHLRSSKQTYTQIAATMVARGMIHLPKDIDAFLALEEIEGRGSSEPVVRNPAEVSEHQFHDPTSTVSSETGDVTTRCEGQAGGQELPLDEMPDGVL